MWNCTHLCKMLETTDIYKVLKISLVMTIFNPKNSSQIKYLSVLFQSCLITHFSFFEKLKGNITHKRLLETRYEGILEEMPRINLTAPKSVRDNRFTSMITPIRGSPTHSCLLSVLLQKVTAVWASCPQGHGALYIHNGAGNGNTTKHKP